MNIVEKISKIFTFTTAYMGGSNYEPLVANQPHQENQEDANHSGRDVKHEAQVVEPDNDQVSKTPTSRGSTNLALRKKSVEIRQEQHKLDARPRAENTDHQNRSLAAENASLKTRLENLQNDHAQAIKRSKQLEKQIEKLVGEKAKLSSDIQADKNGFHQRKTEAEKQIRNLQGKNHKLEEELKMLQGTLRGAREKHSHTAKLLEERSADLKGAQTFLTTIDRYSGADIIKMVEALNAEIFQGAALISELPGDETMIEVDELRKASHCLIQYIGPELFEHLSTKSKQIQVDPFPLQLAVQAILTKWCDFMLQYFYMGPAIDDLSEVYRRIWESEPQAVAGRWRAMMMGQAKHLNSTTYKDHTLDLLYTLLRLCGSSMADLNSQKTCHCLQKVVSTIMDMWIPLKIAIYEGITTAEMKVFTTSPNDRYQDVVMDDIYADVHQSNLGLKYKEHILCAVGMGLQRHVIKRNSDGTIFVQKDIILKAKVVFPSVLFDSA